jgi:hypothetical protein
MAVNRGNKCGIDIFDHGVTNKFGMSLLLFATWVMDVKAVKITRRLFFRCREN